MTDRIYILIFPYDSMNIRSDFLPSPTEGEYTLMIRAPRNETAEPEFAHQIQDSGLVYNNRRNSKTIFQDGSPFTSTLLAAIESDLKGPEFYCFVPGFDIGPPIVKMFQKLVDLDDDSTTDISNLTAIDNVFRLGGKYMGSHYSADKTMTALAERDYAPATAASGGTRTGAGPGAGPGAGTYSFEADDEEGILKLIKSILPGIVYDGYNPKVIRETFISKSTDSNVTAKNLLLVFAAYSFVGNKVAKLTIRRVDKSIGERLMNAISALGVKKVDRSRYGLSMPRIAIAFMPEYLAYRRFIAKDLQSQTESNVDVIYKDIAFYGCEAIRSKSGYPEFHKEFSTYIYEHEKNVAMDDPRFLRDYSRWTKVAIQGYRKDSGIHARMNEILNKTVMSESQVYHFILDGINTDYRATV